ncbi:hypothetical protein [uncultured Bacteroides sp.]|uniref:tetratricopeptide repeat protein n=1 Tax=uncultured Bacteroides sp. TaxID=162156 RepID=UPI00258D0F6E|nr:hypothetical protein [uncultured Bacteroides sp.]
METNTTKRIFLKQLFTSGIICLFDPLQLLAKENKSNSSKISAIDINQLKKEAKTAFYKHDFTKSAQIYHQLIEIAPKDITCYDGLKKVYGANQNTLEIVKLYKNGYNINPENTDFAVRYARALVSLATGNSKHEQLYRDEYQSTNLFEEAISIYNKVIAQTPQNVNLRTGLNHIITAYNRKNYQLQKSQSELIVISDEILNTAHSFLAEYTPNPINTLKNNPRSKLDYAAFTYRIANKKRRNLYTSIEKKVREENIARMKRREGERIIKGLLNERDLTGLFAISSLLLAERSRTTHFIGLLKKRIKLQTFRTYILAIYDKFTAQKQDFWSLIGKGALHYKCDSNSQNALKYYLQAEQNMFVYSAQRIASVYGGQAKCYQSIGSLERSEIVLRKGLDLLGTNNAALSLMILYAQNYVLQGKYADAISMMHYIAGKNKDFETKQDTAFPYLYSLNLDWNTHQVSTIPITQKHPGEHLKVLYALAKMQSENLDREGLTQTLMWINEINPNDRFLKKRQALNI